MARVNMTVNGAEVTVADDHPHLLSALRDELDITSPKDGCSPSGQCGACTVLLNGRAIQSCLVSMEKAAGAEVTTIEGFDPGERERYASAFAVAGAVQCGFCTPGILVRTKALFDQKGPDRVTSQIAAGRLGAHLCRCTGYAGILDAVEMLASGSVPPLDVPAGVGKNGVKYEAIDLALGERGYVDDLRPEDLLDGAFRLTDHARADVRRIDTTRAKAADGVVAVITAADVPGELKVGLIYKDWPVFIPEGGRTSYYGDVLAMVVAETRRQARAAAALIDVEYDVLQPFADAKSALVSDENAVWGLDGNVLSTSRYQRGDTDGALAAAAHTLHEAFKTQRVEHAFLEPESTLAVPDGNGHLHVYSGGQGIWDDRNQIASLLGIDEGDVTVESVSNGGAFGGKEDMSNQGQTALAAHLLQRPVKCTLSREESFRIHGKRHAIEIEVWAGCDSEGKLTALRSRMVGDTGPYASVGGKVLERAAGHMSGPYVIDNIDVEAVAVRTNNPVGGAFRGFGANQAQFAMEGIMDRFAEAVGISGWEIRSRNLVSPGVVWGPGQIMDDGCRGARACLDAVKPAYDAARREGKAVGLGLGIKNSGLGNGFREVSRAVVRFDEDDTVEVQHPWTEMGQGVHTVAQQVAAEELGIDPARIRIVSDTKRDLGAGQTTGSRGTLMAAGSVRDACRVANENGRAPGVDYQGEYVVDWTDSLEDGVENPIIHSAFGYAAQLVIADPKTAIVEKVVAAHDVGRAVNPALVGGQIVGAVHMGLGYALTEEFPTDDQARPTKMTLRSLGILRAKDMPDVESIIVEVPQPRAPYGIKGVGEIGLVPTSGAVVAALHEVDGKWRSRVPMRVHDPIETSQL